MEALSLKQRIVNYLTLRGEWVSKQELVDIIKRAYDAENKGITTDHIGRTLRTMAEDGDINADYYQGKKKQKLVKYASSNQPKEVKQKINYQIVIRDGKPVAQVI